MTVSDSPKSLWREYLEAIVIAVLLALFIRTFIFQAFKIPSGSMLPTLQIGDHLLVNKFIYGVRNPFTGNVLIPVGKPRHGDVVVFRFPKDRSVDYIKRIVGTEGDTIQVRDKKVFVNDQLELTGIVDRRLRRFDKQGKKLVVEGRDLMGLIVDSVEEVVNLPAEGQRHFLARLKSNLKRRLLECFLTAAFWWRSLRATVWSSSGGRARVAGLPARLFQG